MASIDEPENQAPAAATRVLARNAACHQCRKRKLKCDAIRPICANCQKPRPRANPGGAVICTWDELSSPGADSDSTPGSVGATKSKKRKETDDNGGKKARLHELEERVAAFEKALQNKEAEATYAAGSSLDLLASQAVPALPLGVGMGAATSFALHAPEGQFASWSTGAETTNYAAMPTSTSDQDWLASLTGAAASAQPIGAGPSSKANNVDNVYELIWPDWPRDLPSLDIVEHVVGVFFDKVPTIPKMFNRSTFMNSLQLPPKHAKFPARALLHAILGLTAPHLAQDQLATRAFFPVGAAYNDILHPDRDFEDEPTYYRNMSGSFHNTQWNTAGVTSPLGRFQMWHRRKCLMNLAREFDRGEKLLQAVQAQIVVTTIDAYNAWWTDLWMEAGACVRMAVPLQLNESPNVPADALQRFRHVLIPQATDPAEQALRDRIWWMAYITERSVNMSTAWAEALDDSEITVELPVTQALFDAGNGGLQGTQTLHSHDLFAAHPVQHADGFVLYIKATKLYGDVSRFFRRYGRGSHAVAGYLAHPQLRVFLSQINSFRLSFPAHLRRPTGDGLRGGQRLDVDLVSAILLTHSITLGLGEPVITKEMHNSDFAKMCLSAIRAVLSLVYDITSTSFDLSLLPYTCSYVWFTCGKGLCRFIDAAILNGDLVAASVYRSECEVFRMAMRRHGERYPIANRHLKMLDELIRLQSASSEAFQEKVFMDCTKLTVFDPEYTPTVDSATKNSTASSATPSSAAPTPNSYIIIPMGQAPAHESGAVPDPVKAYWHDEFPKIPRVVDQIAEPGVGSTAGGAMPVGYIGSGGVGMEFEMNGQGMAQGPGVAANSFESSGRPRMPTTGHVSPASGIQNSSALPSTTAQPGVTGMGAAFAPTASSLPPGTYNFNLNANGVNSAKPLDPGVGQIDLDDLDLSKWFDIPNLSYDPSSLDQMAGMAEQSGAMFTPGQFAAMYP